jgi:hypothetical protein
MIFRSPKDKQAYLYTKVPQEMAAVIEEVAAAHKRSVYEETRILINIGFAQMVQLESMARKKGGGALTDEAYKHAAEYNEKRVYPDPV